MSDRFFVTSPITADRAELTGDEARHLASVMRAKPGDDVLLFDGSGSEFAAQITAIRKHAVELRILSRRAISRELPFELTLAVALPKGERQKWLVEKLTELGVTGLVPVITERGVAQPTDATLDRLRRATIEASKQSGRNCLMSISPPVTAGALFAAASPGAVRLIADPKGEPLTALPPARQSSIIVAIGPEGGFGLEEIAAAQSAGWRLVSLGPRILRVETAAIALAAWAALH